MTKNNLLIIYLALVTVFITPISQSVAAQTITSKDNQAKETINDAIAEAIDNTYSNIDMLNISKKNDNSTIVIYNISQLTPEIPPVCGPGQHLENGVCVNDEGEEPERPTGESTNMTISGDFSGGTGTHVIDAMKNRNADWNVAIGDMGYQDDLSAFKQKWNQLNNALCTIGNHDAENRNIYKESIKFCSQLWFHKIAGNTTLMLGFDTDGNMETLGDAAVKKLDEPGYMDGVKNVLLVSHKPCETHPNSHHNSEQDVEDFCKTVTEAISQNAQGVKIVYIAGHNHEQANTKDETKFTAGGGGRESHRQCGENNEWTFCTEEPGFLELVINNDTGEIKADFYDVNGEVIR